MHTRILKELISGVANAILILSVSVFVLSIIAKSIGIYINTTPSLPLGFYKIIDEPIQKDAHVAFCPLRTELLDDARARGYIGSGDCPGGYGLLLKRVMAMAGDTVLIDQAGIAVNGKNLPNSAQLRTDRHDRPLPQYHLDAVLNEAEYLLLSDLHPQSFDARYFGLINREQIHHVVRPVLTWSPNSKEPKHE